MEVSAVGRFAEGSGILRYPVLYLQHAFGTDSKKKHHPRVLRFCVYRSEGVGVIRRHTALMIFGSRGMDETMGPSTDMIF